MITRKLHLSGTLSRPLLANHSRPVIRPKAIEALCLALCLAPCTSHLRCAWLPRVANSLEPFAVDSRARHGLAESQLCIGSPQTRALRFCIRTGSARVLGSWKRNAAKLSRTIPSPLGRLGFLCGVLSSAVLSLLKLTLIVFFISHWPLAKVFGERSVSNLRSASSGALMHQQHHCIAPPRGPLTARRPIRECAGRSPAASQTRQ